MQRARTGPTCSSARFDSALAGGRFLTTLPSIPNRILIAIPWPHRRFVPVAMSLHFERLPVHRGVARILRQPESILIRGPILIVSVPGIRIVCFIVLAEIGLVWGNISDT